MAFQQYLAEEVAIDHADGLSRGGRRCGASPCSGGRARGLGAAGRLWRRRRAGRPSTTTGAGEAAAPPTPGGGDRGDHLPRPGGTTVQGAWAAAASRAGAVLVIHENRGLNDHIRSVAGRLAADGYSALAIDLLSEEGGTAALAARPRRRPPLGQRPAGAVRRRHAGRPGRAGAAGARPEARRDRVLLRRRHGLAAAGRRASRAWPRPRRSTARSPTAPTSPARPTRPCSASTPSRTTG